MHDLPHAQNVAAVSTSIMNCSHRRSSQHEGHLEVLRRLGGFVVSKLHVVLSGRPVNPRLGVVHSRELGMLWLWSEMPAEDGNKMKPLCFRWHLSLWSIGGFHDVPQLYQGWWCGVWPYGLLQPHWPLGSYSDESHGICIPRCKWRKLAQA